MDDPALPRAAQLLGAGASRILAPAVAADGGRLVRARPTQVRYDPQRQLVVRYAARVRWPHGEHTETLGALLRRDGVTRQLATAPDASGTTTAVWRYPHDPCLPGLPHAAYPGGVAQLLRKMGLPEEPAEITPLVYRPLQRALVRVRTPSRVLYLKIVPPHQTWALRRTHEAFGEHLHVPRCVAWSDEHGLLVFTALPGTALTHRLVDGAQVPSPTAIICLLRRIRAVTLPQAQRATATRAAWYGRVLQDALPEAAGQVSALVAQARVRPATTEVVTHGDLYPAHLLVQDREISGVLDLDSAGRGSPVDDPATVVAHLIALAHVRPAARLRIAAYRRALQSALADEVETAALHPAVTGVLLGLATTPFRRQQHRWRERTLEWLALARAWADDGATA